ncbi:hypothetical protein [Metallosphaera hakonensis]|uniref:hypothetical protein n=1 Tax=Metallosphaera hakonensis TaxID=79601 RepID=UPI001F10103D|nr:hypothetical protein [Metallosphaera hakonensis]
MKPGLLVIAGIATAIALAYLSVVIASLPLYPFHDRPFRDDMETGIYLGKGQYSVLYFPQTAFEVNGSTVYLSYLNMQPNYTWPIFNGPNCATGSRLVIEPANISTSPNGTATFIVTLKGNGFIHMIGDNRFYKVVAFQEQLTADNITITVTLSLNNVPPGQLKIPIWNNCQVEYVNVTIYNSTLN